MTQKYVCIYADQRWSFLLQVAVFCCCGNFQKELDDRKEKLCVDVESAPL